MELIGTLKVKYDVQKVSDRFQKRDFVLTTEENTPYPQFVQLQLVQDKVGILDMFSEGAQVRVQFNVRGRLWNGPQGDKYFNTLDAWRIEAVAGTGTTAQPTTSAPAPTTPTTGTPVFTSNPGDNDDLPY